MNKTIDLIRAIRERNNVKWMEILEIALRSAPEETKIVLSEINRNDKKISILLGELANE